MMATRATTVNGPSAALIGKKKCQTTSPSVVRAIPAQVP